MGDQLGSIRTRLTMWYAAVLALTLAVSVTVLYVGLAGSLGVSSPFGLLTMHGSTAPATATGQADELRASVGHLLGGSVLVIPLVVVLGVAGGLFLASRALDPIDRIIRTANSIGAGRDLGRRLNLPHTSDELGRLTRTLDGMLERLEEAFQRERQLTTDVAHEIRTPLAAVIIQAEVALSQYREAQDYRHALQAIQSDATRLAVLVDQMLQLARAEAGLEPLTREPVELCELAGEVLNSVRPLSASRGVELELVASQRVWVIGDQVRLTQVLLNLVTNAMQHVEPGGCISVGLSLNGGIAELQVVDTGAGISPEHLPRIFDRFYRADPARQRDQGGAGLGLAIGRWIVEAHGGSIQVQSEVGRGTTFTVRLPLASNGAVLPEPGVALF